MVKRLPLPTRSFGAEPGVPNISSLSEWIAGHRGKPADILTYRIDRSLAPQVPAGITVPCAGGLFYGERVLSTLIGVSDKSVVDELGVETRAVIGDAVAIAAGKNNAWCAMPAPHLLGIVDAYYDDEDEWIDAITGAYRTLMRAMRDAGIPGHILIGERADDAEIARLARRNVFFFFPEQDRERLECVLEHQPQVTVSCGNLDLLFNLANEYEIQRIFLLDADEGSIARVLSDIDPDQLVLGGYCKDTCDTYWQELADGAFYRK